MSQPTLLQEFEARGAHDGKETMYAVATQQLQRFRADQNVCIDNSSLQERAEDYIGEIPLIDPMMRLGTDFQLVTSGQWQLLQSHCHAQPEFQFHRKSINQQYCFSGATVRIGVFNRPGTYRVLYLPKDTLRNVMLRIAHFLTAEEVRLWRPDFGQLHKIQEHAKISSQFPGTQLSYYYDQPMVDFQKSKLKVQGPEIIVVEQPPFHFNFETSKFLTGKCENCFKTTVLKAPCSCGKVAYCDSQCRQNDLKWHEKSCEQQFDPSNFKLYPVALDAANGRCGLNNIGNTCYLNSAVQCLSNITHLRQFIFSDQMLQELNPQNPLGSKGATVALSFAQLLSKLWHTNLQSRDAAQFKKFIGLKNPQFANLGQHDSQEFLNFLLDTLHEDFNRVKQKAAFELPDLEGNDFLVSKVYQAFNLKRNQSIIMDLFQGTYKSSLKCPCGFDKVRFEPFTSVALPISASPILTYFFVPINLREPITIFKIQVPNAHKAIQTILPQVKQQITSSLQRPIKNLIFALVKNPGLKLVQLLKPNLQLSSIMSSPCLTFVYESEPCEIAAELSIHESTSIPRLAFINKSDSMGEIASSILDRYRAMSSIEPRLKIKTADNLAEFPNDSWSLNHFLDFNAPSFQNNEQLFETSYSTTPTTHGTEITILTLVLCYSTSWYQQQEWEALQKQLMNVQQDTHGTYKQQGTTIQKCLQLFRQTEKLSKEESWKCEKCDQQVEATKTMDLYQTGPYLVFTLKRFKNYNQKINCFVECPIRDLNMAEHLVPNCPQNSVENKPLQRYNLVGVINHFGEMESGHYTAACLNNGQWLHYNDSIVTEIPEDQVVTEAAYVCFYQKQTSVNKSFADFKIKSEIGDPLKFAHAVKVYREKKVHQQPPQQPPALLIQHEENKNSDSNENDYAIAQALSQVEDDVLMD